MHNALSRLPDADVPFADPPAVPRPFRCLWLARYLPYPLDAGAKVYSAKLAASLAAAGAYVRFAGFGDREAAFAADPRIDWVAVPGVKRSSVAALWSSLPVAAAIDATTGYEHLLDHELAQHWDAIVFDGYGAGWALHRFRNEHGAITGGGPLLVHVSHNHEARLWTDMARDARSSVLRRMALRHNARRIGTLEGALLEDADLVTTITDEDRVTFSGGRPGTKPMLTLTPGYTGWVAPERRITAATPRHVLLMGSFNWVVKRENLLRFVEAAEPAFQKAGITLDVVGDVPSALLEPLKARCKATRFHGFVEQSAPFFETARLALVPELIGGGFKLKFLDYFFGRVPVATIAEAAAGLPARLRAETLQCRDLESLVASVVAHIDQTEILDGMQQRAFAAAQGAFRWEDRGVGLLTAMQELRTPVPAKQQMDLNVGMRARGDS